MTNAANTVMTLYNWNILILPSGEEIFVGLRQQPETVPPFKPADEEE